MTEIVIYGLTGNTPYNIYVCNEDGSSCYWLDNITDGDVPYSFVLPPPFDSIGNYFIKAVDVNDCEIIVCDSLETFYLLTENYNVINTENDDRLEWRT